MNATGFVRKIDRLGRISIPKELRDALEIKNGSLLEMFVDDHKIMLLKAREPGCVFCKNSNPETNLLFQEHLVCLKCVSTLKKLTDFNTNLK